MKRRYIIREIMNDELHNKLCNNTKKIEKKLKQEAMKRIGGSMVYVSKKKVNWDLKPK